ncbi:uncharacterized protein LOC127103790 [Lathyrus oleraceus]|uniref:uncharacterized protein LOC127103790 n=1 Tax=Pisum sativum TaxID=3888 RepID=UPI0021CFB793|nr:uncharacterized protein LOC127103790 [Pisum sativum]
MPSAKKRVVGKKIPANVPKVPIDNISFYSVEKDEKWKYVYQRRLTLERELRKDALECKEMVDLIEDAGLMKSVYGFCNCHEMLVKEFIVNISKDCGSKMSNEYRKVYVRGKCVDFSLKVINKFRGRREEEQVEMEVTGLGKFIYIIGTKTKFDFGSYVFEQTMKHANSFAMKMLIAFPFLICGVTLNQHPGILSSFNVTSKREYPLSFHYRLFAGTHVPDIVVTSGKDASSSTSGEGIIVELKDTCKALNETIESCTEKKIRLESWIKALSKEDIYGNLDGDKEEGNKDEGNVVACGDKDEETYGSADI